MGEDLKRRGRAPRLGGLQGALDSVLGAQPTRRPRFSFILAGLSVFVFYICYVWTPWSSAAPSGIVASQAPIDAIAFICMGAWTQTTILHNAVASLRSTGGWRGPVYVLTDRSDGWPSLRDGYNVDVIHVDGGGSKLAIHSFKCKMFDVLPSEVGRVLYMDADIIVSRPLTQFFNYLAEHAATHGDAQHMGFFRDSGGHFWGFCNECDYWHGGVMLATRTVSEPCLHVWCSAIASGRFPADQPALDYISEHEPVCKGMFPMDSRYLMFMKDYTAAFLGPTKTFSHVTAAGRLEEQDWFYRLMVRLKLGVTMSA